MIDADWHVRTKSGCDVGYLHSPMLPAAGAMVDADDENRERLVFKFWIKLNRFFDLFIINHLQFFHFCHSLIFMFFISETYFRNKNNKWLITLIYKSEMIIAQVC